MPPVYEFVDPDALDNFIDGDVDPPARFDGYVTVTYAGHSVTVYADGKIGVHDLDPDCPKSAGPPRSTRSPRIRFDSSGSQRLRLRLRLRLLATMMTVAAMPASTSSLRFRTLGRFLAGRP